VQVAQGPAPDVDDKVVRIEWNPIEANLHDQVGATVAVDVDGPRAGLSRDRSPAP
jgi:hypothetical protein